MRPEKAPDTEPDDKTEAEAETPQAPLLELRDGLPPVVDSEGALSEIVEAIRSGSGPVAVDAERASGYRYSARAYLIQLRREGSGSALVDPIPFEDMSALDEAIGDAEWILHAATQDLPCLNELGMRPAALFDTELAGRLLGYPRVGLATLVETIVGRRMRKEHSAVDWSTRPLPEPWLEYAALDVEVLIELRNALADELERTGKTEWARQEFQHLVDALPNAPRQDPWRRTSGMHRARGRRALAAVRELWEARDAIAAQRDVTPGRIIPDSAIVEAANALPGDRAALLALKGFKGRGAQRYANRWVEALRTARALPENELPPLAARYDGPPPPRAWADRDPVAAARLTSARSELAELAKDLNIPVENLLTPDFVRRLMWEPPDVEKHELADAVSDRLRSLGAREWQVGQTIDVLTRAILTAPAKVASQPEQTDAAESTGS
ncbi:MAG TPA: HRDC domain-containing protein [Nocardioidaceae bacterium]|nr:HRDC domain-containing protein [Nocardioidaceae bacterium]